MEPEVLQPLGLPNTSLEVSPGTGWHVDIHLDIDTTCYGNGSLGVDMEVVSGSMKATKYHSGDDEGYSRWSGELPQEMTFDMTRADVLAHLGTPDEASSSEQPTWDRFERADLVIRVQYGEVDEKVTLVSVSKV